VNTLVDVHCRKGKRINSSSRDFPHSIKLLLLNEIGVIDDYRFAALDYFRKLRNRAAHDPFFSIDMENLKGKFNQLARRAPSGQHTLRAKNYYEFCLYIVLTLWIDHQKTFTAIFMQETPAKTANQDLEATR